MAFMAKGKTPYQFTVTNVNQAVQEINNFLSANDYVRQVDNNGNVFYKRVNIMTGNFGLEYYVNGNQVTVYVYILGRKDEAYIVDDGLVGEVGKQPILHLVQPLLNSLSNLSIQQQPYQNQGMQQQYQGGQQYQNQQQQYQGGQQYQNQQQQYQGGQQQYQGGQQPYVPTDYKSAKAQADGKKAIVAFVLSLVGLIVSILGIVYGIPLIIVIYYLAYVGIKSNKKGLAIAAMVINSIDLLILLLAIVATIME